MERSACKVDESTGDIILRFVVGFPARGRSIDAGEFEKILFRLLPGVVEKSGIFKLFTENEKVKLKEQIELSDESENIEKGGRRKRFCGIYSGWFDFAKRKRSVRKTDEKCCFV